MNHTRSLFWGMFGIFAFAWLGLTVIPHFQIGRLEPQADEEGGDVYPAPPNGMAIAGERIYAANGCVYCHSQQVRADYAATDIARKWGERRSAPRDYLFDRPVQLGKLRTGPDLANVGRRAPVEDVNAPAITTASPAPGSSPAVAPPPAGAPAPVAQPAPGSSPTLPSASAVPGANPPGPADQTTTVNGAPLPYSADWHHKHLYDPQSVTEQSIMPPYRFLYRKQRISGEPSADAVKIAGEGAPADGWEIVPTYDAKCLVAYLMSRDQSHPLKEVKSTAPTSPPAPGKAVAK